MVTLTTSDGQLVPLVKSSFETNVFDSVQSTTLSLAFCNSSESEYQDVALTMPIDPKASIFHMSVTIGDRIIMAEVHEKEEAIEIYKKARNEGVLN